MQGGVCACLLYTRRGVTQKVRYVSRRAGAAGYAMSSGEHEHQLCDRGASRAARKAARKLLFDVADAHGVTISSGCPLHPDNDWLLPHEKHKQPLSRQQWRCALCGKTFRNEHYMDMHMERKHPELITANASVCPGEYCDILRCPSWVDELRRQPARCDEPALRARRHLCQHMLHDCVSDDVSAGGHQLFETLDESLCKPCRSDERGSTAAGMPARRPFPTAGQGRGSPRASGRPALWGSVCDACPSRRGCPVCLPGPGRSPVRCKRCSARAAGCLVARAAATAAPRARALSTTSARASSSARWPSSTGQSGATARGAPPPCRPLLAHRPMGPPGGSTGPGRSCATRGAASAACMLAMA